MNITEEQKQEADRIVIKYMSQFHPVTVNNHVSKLVITFAIQDRQSVLEVVRKAFNRTSSSKGFNHYFDDEIQSLTNQITYLKSKI